MRRFIPLSLVVLAILLSSIAVPLRAADPPTDGKRTTAEQVKPKWEVGQTWIVETRSRPVQVAAVTDKDALGKPIQWQFSVKGLEKVNDRDCYRVEIARADKTKREPTTTFWADKETLSLRKTESQRLVQGTWQKLTQSYESKDGAPVAVLGVANAIPVDLPSFSSEKTRGKAAYRSISGGEKTRGVGDNLNLVTSVDQQVAPADPERVSKWLGEKTRGGEGPLVEVRLKTPVRQVDQFWQPGSPWPTYSDDGTTVSRLVPQR